MNIIIAGAGRVGFNLAKTLCISHNVTVIDRNAEALKRLNESLDILVLHGNIENPETYKKLSSSKADLFIAVTNTDEANLISTLIADDVIEIKRKFIRLRNTYYAKSSIKEKLSIAETIFPLELTSSTVASLLDYVHVNNVKHFKYTDLKLVSIRASNTLSLQSLESQDCSVVGIERKKNFFIPTSKDTIEINDLVYCFGKEEVVRKLNKPLQLNEPKAIKRCVIFGASDLGVSIAKSLIDKGIEIKILDKDIELCKKADEALEGDALTINCKYSMQDIFEEEGLKYADMVIATTSNDEYNIIKCLDAKEHGIQKVVAIINELEYYNLMHTLGIVVVRGPKMNAYNEIMERINSSDVVMERRFCGGKGIIYLRKIFPNTSLINKKLKPINNKELISFILRDKKLHPFDTVLLGKENDVIIVFCQQTFSLKVKSWIYEL